MTAKTVIYLDVDGVVNNLRRDRALQEWTDMTVYQVKSPIEGDNRTFPIMTSETLGEELMKLDADIKWLTTWADAANSHISPICGLPEDLEIVARPTDEVKSAASGLLVATTDNWKLNGILKDQEKECRPFIWVDDDAITISAINHLKRGDYKFTYVIPHSWREGGLLRSHIETMKQMIEDFKGKDETDVPEDQAI